ncbi:MAG: carboxypeptidase regulatory-like domain-containing protein [Planctomycetes bacterium]|nr:carboxypeptidase regulatory-like domain-containing protein [Planctomycetota bacterium]
MKNVVLGAVVLGLVVVVLLAWMSWSAAAGEPRPVAPEQRAQDLSGPAPAPATGDAPPAEHGPGHYREAVGEADGSATAAPASGVRLSCIWADDETAAASIPVRVYRVKNRRLDGPVAAGVSAADGVVLFPDLEPGEHEFRSGRHETRATVATGVMTEAKLSLKGGAIVAGRVVDSAEAAIVGAEVHAVIAGFPQRIAVTDTEGRFEVRTTVPTRIWATRDGYLPSDVLGLKLGRGDIVLGLETTEGSIRGTVVDPDGRTVAGATVAIGVELARDGVDKKKPHVVAKTDARGEFASAQVPRGPILVYAIADGFAFGMTKADTTDTANAVVVVRLTRAASIHGVVLGGDGNDEPQVGAPLETHRQRDLVGLLQGTSDTLTRFSALTDENGRYRITGLPPGRTWVMIGVRQGMLHHNVLLQEGEDHEWNPDLAVPSAVIRGVLLGPDGNPLAGWKVMASRVDRIEMKYEHQEAETGADGSFAIGKLRPLPHALELSAPDVSEPIARRQEVPANGPAFVWQLTGLPSQSGEIIGRLLGPDGKPVTAKIQASSEGVTRGGEGLAEPEGGFRVGRVVPGTWQIGGKLEGYGTFELGSHRVAANATVDIGVHQLPAPGHVVVRHSARDFVPQDVALLLTQIEGGKNKTSEFTAVDGDLHSPPLPPGRYRLQARGSNFALLEREVTIRPGAAAAV